jgi:hypothetical protein
MVYIPKLLGVGHLVTNAGNIAIKNVVILLNLSVIIISSLFLFYKEIKGVLNRLIDTEKMYKYFLTDDICSLKQPAIYLFFIGSMTGIFFNAFQITFGQPVKEGFMEDNTTLMYLVAVFVLMISTFQIKKSFFSSHDRVRILVFLFILSAFLVVVFGEEVSWGQRVIGYESFGVFEKYNYQDEVNFHNFFNPLFKYAYPMVGMSTFLILFLIWQFDKKDKSHLFYLLVPHRSLFLFVFFMAASTYNGHSEIFEELVSVFSLLYSIRLFFCLRFPMAKASEKLG